MDMDTISLVFRPGRNEFFRFTIHSSIKGSPLSVNFIQVHA